MGGRSWKGPLVLRATEGVGVSEARPSPLAILQLPGHSGDGGLGCPVAVAGWLPELILGWPFCPVWMLGLSGVDAPPLRGGCPASQGWVPRLSGVDHPPFLVTHPPFRVTPTDGYRLHLLGLRCAGDPRRLVPCTPPSWHCAPGASPPVSFGGPAMLPPSAAHRGLGRGRSISTWEQGARRTNAPSSEDPTPQGQSLQPLQGSTYLPTPAHPPAPTLCSSTTTQAPVSGRCQTSLLLAHRMGTEWLLHALNPHHPEPGGRGGGRAVLLGLQEGFSPPGQGAKPPC